MAIVIESSYGKTIGLPGYSSHKFLVSVKSEVTDVADVPAEAGRMYRILQESVDAQLTNPGFIPGEKEPEPVHSHVSGNGNGTAAASRLDTRTRMPEPAVSGGAPTWRCSDKQRELIVRIIDENRLNRTDINRLALERFGCEVPELNKLQASGLIDELLERHGGNRSRLPRRATAARGRP